ncbi:MAG: hypothetical protein GEU91_00830 [Rhizobiales bacterium]|nr:hypothetical protein [Hyphomicrobiales bacterium]
MPNDETLRRTLLVRFTLPGGDPHQLLTMMQAAAPFYQAFGGMQMTLLQNVDDASRFVQVIAYETRAGLEANRQQVASDPRVQAYLQAIRMLVPGGVDVDVHREIGAGADGKETA